MSRIAIRPATEKDTPLILSLIQGLAEYEKLAHEVVATEEKLRATLFGPRPGAEVLIGGIDTAEPAGLAEPSYDECGFALFFSSYSTFLARPGIYLEDLFVRPDRRGQGLGKALLQRLAALVIERGGGRLEWSVLDWNRPAIEFYEKVGAMPMSEWTVYRLTGDKLARFARATDPN
jgi:GNAT superfamily N-acetyltransferase